MIDLHLHSTASDGALSPSSLVQRAHAAGLTLVSLTDHDTVSGLAEAREAGDRIGVRIIPGIEMTSIEHGRDVHVLGYWFDDDHDELLRFLERQRSQRLLRVAEIAARLADLGCAVDLADLQSRTRRGRSIGRPQVADALVAAGYVRDRSEAFDRWLAEGRPAYVARQGPSPEEVISMIGAAGGMASLAHPGLLDMDSVVPRLAAAGLKALEARHPDHDAETESRYRSLAAQAALAVSGGSDYHGDHHRHGSLLGCITLPAEDFETLEAHRR